MDERKQRILRAIIEDYVKSAEPVGSRTIAKNYNLALVLLQYGMKCPI